MFKKKLSGRCLVIQLTSEKTRIAVSELGAAAPRLSDCLELETPNGAVEDGYIRSLKPLEELLRETLKRPEYKRVRQVVFSLCTTQIVSEQTGIPAMSLRKLGKMLETNMDVYFPMDVRDYRLVWQQTGRGTDKEGRPELQVHLWAVPSVVISQYYALANNCGLSVAALDFFGCSCAAAFGVSFSGPKAAKQDKLKPEIGEEEQEQTLWLLAEREHLLMTFVRNGQITLQRVLLRGRENDELTEALMVLEYYRSGGKTGEISLKVCGELAEDPEYLRSLEDTFRMTAGVCSCAPGPAWCVCLGALSVSTDFGDRSLDHPRGVSRKMGGVWQYFFVLAGGLLLAAALILNFGSKAIWDAEIKGLEDTKRGLELEAAKNQGAAQRYRDYENRYNAYSNDWDRVFSLIKTNNNSLSRMLDEVERIIPNTAYILSVGINDKGVGLEIACKEKDQVTQLILALRDMEYASLAKIYDTLPLIDINRYNTDGLNMNRGVRPANGRAMLGFLETDEESRMIPVPAQPGGSGEQTGGDGQQGSEEPPKEGGFPPEFGPAMVEEYLRNANYNAQASSLGNIFAGISADKDFIDFVKAAVTGKLVTPIKIKLILDELEEKHIDALEDVYVQYPDPETVPDLGYLLQSEPDYDTKKNALENMFRKDPFAARSFSGLMVDDTNRAFGDYILCDDEMSAKLYDLAEKNKAALSGDMYAAKSAALAVFNLVTADKETTDRTIRLLRQDKELESRFAYHLAKRMGLLSPETPEGGLNLDLIIGDMTSTHRPENKDAADAVDTIVKILGINLKPPAQKSGGGGLPQDFRYVISVALRYKPELIDSELDRKGLDRDLKIEKVGVES